MDPTVLELGAEKGTKNKYCIEINYISSKSIGIFMILIHSILYHNLQTWIESLDKDLNCSEIKGQKEGP